MAVPWSQLRSERCPVNLDTLLMRGKEGKIDIGVYRKFTHMDRYVQYSSHHPEHVKRGKTSCLFCRSRTMAVGENIQKEKHHLRMVLRTNGFPEHAIKAAARPRKGTTQEEQPKYTICLLYVAGVGEDLRRVCRNLTSGRYSQP